MFCKKCTFPFKQNMLKMTKDRIFSKITFVFIFLLLFISINNMILLFTRRQDENLLGTSRDQWTYQISLSSKIFVFYLNCFIGMLWVTGMLSIKVCKSVIPVIMFKQTIIKLPWCNGLMWIATSNAKLLILRAKADKLLINWCPLKNQLFKRVKTRNPIN